MSNKKGYRGYVSSRSVRAMSYPQRVQNLVIRDYANRKQIDYLLSSTEFAMPGCYMMLEDLLSELVKLEGIIFFSAFMLPQRKSRRLDVYWKVLANQCSLHAALEGIALQSEADIERFEDVVEVANTLPDAPLSDAYQSFRLKLDDKDTFVEAIFNALD